MNKEEILRELSNYSGTEEYHKIPFSDIVYTDGINGMIELCKCWWLISDLGIEVSNNPKLQKPFLVVRIRVDENKKAIIDLREDTDEKPIYSKTYDYTDFPIDKYEFYLTNKVFLLMGEY